MSLMYYQRNLTVPERRFVITYYVTATVAARQFFLPRSVGRSGKKNSEFKNNRFVYVPCVKPSRLLDFYL